MEITSQKWRSFMGIMTQMGFAIGVISLSGFAYKWRNWRNLQIAISFVPIPFILFWFFIPESPRFIDLQVLKYNLLYFIKQIFVKMAI